MKLKKLLLSFLTIALLITLVIPSSFATSEELPTSFSETLETTFSTSENSSESVSHEQIAKSLGVTSGTYEELQSDPNAPRKTYYYIEYTTNNDSDNSTMSSEASEPTVTVVPPQDYPKFIENKKREYELSKSDTSVQPFRSRGDAGGIGIISTLRTTVYPTIESSTEVDVIVGDTPKIIEFYTTFTRSNSRNYGGYTASGTHKKEFQRSDVRVGATATHFHTVTQTGFYYSSVKLRVLDGMIVVLPVGETTVLSNMILLNSKGVEYPYYYDPHARRMMPEPETTLYPRGYLPGLQWRSSVERSDYIKEYNKAYPWNTITWENVTHVHHIRPRVWGGDNSFYNLIPLPKQFHTGVVSPWWTGY